VLDQQLHAAAATVESSRRVALNRDLRAAAPARADLLAALVDPMARMERERPNLMAFVESAAAVEPAYAWQLPRASWRYLWLGGYSDDIAELHQRGLTVAEAIGDRSAQATTLHYLASAHFIRAELTKACELTQRVIRLREQLGETDAVTVTMANLANVYWLMDRWTDCIEVAQAALRRRRAGKSAVDAAVEMTLAQAYVRLGRYPDALRYQRRALMIGVDAHDPVRIGGSLLLLATTKHLAGITGIEATRRQLRVASRLAQRAGDRPGELDARHELANLLRVERRYAEAIVEHRHVLAAVTRLRIPWFESRMRSDFAVSLRLAGQTAAARAMAQHALRIARQFQLPYLAARAQTALAECLLATDPARGRQLWEQARDTYARLGAAELTDVEQQLRR
jgi:tetratricopeptide (TPR) repeat protein